MHSFFSVDLPQYSSLEVMRDRLLFAITHCQVRYQSALFWYVNSGCQAIDADHLGATVDTTTYSDSEDDDEEEELGVL